MPEQHSRSGHTRWNQTRPVDDVADTVPLGAIRYDADEAAGVHLLDSGCDANKELKIPQPQANWRRRIVREKRLPIVLLLCLLIPIAVVAHRSSKHESPTNPRPAFYFIGDSITELGSTPGTGGWVTLMQDQYARSVDVINRGLSGWNTRWFIERALSGYEAELSSGQFSPALITVWFGANDAVLIDNDLHSQHVPEDEYRSNLVIIMDRLRLVAPEAKIILITPPGVDEAARLAYSTNGKLERSNEATGRYAEICVEVAQAEAVSFIDLYSLLNTFQEANFSSQFVDGLHFSRNGNRLFFDQLIGKIAEIFDVDAATQFPIH